MAHLRYGIEITCPDARAQSFVSQMLIWDEGSWSECLLVCDRQKETWNEMSCTVSSWG